MALPGRWRLADLEDHPQYFPEVDVPRTSSYQPSWRFACRRFSEVCERCALSPRGVGYRSAWRRGFHPFFLRPTTRRDRCIRILAVLSLEASMTALVVGGSVGSRMGGQGTSQARVAEGGSGGARRGAPLPSGSRPYILGKVEHILCI
jgi:hypothetical protein